jgi:integrase/recombinase XerD
MKFEAFLKEKRYLDNVAETTIKYYGYVFNRWMDYVGEEPTSENIKTFVMKVRESGVSIYTANSYIRGINAYLRWAGTGLVIKKLKEPQKLLTLFTEKQLEVIVKTKGVKFAERRLHALCCLLIDTGARIDELLNLRKCDVDFDNLLIKVTGKGRKDRMIPISRECRAVLFRWCRHEYDFVFPARGHKWAYRSALDQFKRLCDKLGVDGARCSFHTFRHYFAVNYIRSGGDLYRLSKTLGHTDIQTTAIYLKHMGIEPIQEAHHLHSPLSRL